MRNFEGKQTDKCWREIKIPWPPGAVVIDWLPVDLKEVLISSKKRVI